MVHRRYLTEIPAVMVEKEMRMMPDSGSLALQSDPVSSHQFAGLSGYDLVLQHAPVGFYDAHRGDVGVFAGKKHLFHAYPAGSIEGELADDVAVPSSPARRPDTVTDVSAFIPQWWRQFVSQPARAEDAIIVNQPVCCLANHALRQPLAA